MMFRRFLLDETGSVTVEFLLLPVACMVAAVIIFSVVEQGMTAQAETAGEGVIASVSEFNVITADCPELEAESTAIVETRGERQADAAMGTDAPSPVGVQGPAIVIAKNPLVTQPRGW